MRSEDKEDVVGYDEKAEQDFRGAELIDELDVAGESTKRGLKSRHSQMLALGGTVGTGLFVGTGATLARGGPAFIFVGYLVMTFLILGVVTAITEVATYLPVTGGTMSYFGHRYVSSSLGFAMGYLYWYSLGILVPYEITAAGLVIDYWGTPVNIGVWITIFILVIVALNFLPVKFYGETEFWFASLKLFLVMGLLLLSFILFWGGGPSRQRLGFHYWKDPGATTTYLVGGKTGTFVAFVSTVVLSSFPFAFAPEMLVVTGGEMRNPQRNLPRASKRYFWRLIVIYVGSVFAMGVICPYNDPDLTSGGSTAKASPFVIGIKIAGIHGLDSVVNAAIILSAWSSGNSFLYLSSRSLYSLAVSNNAPSVFRRCNRWGVPYVAVSTSSLFTVLAYMNCASSGSNVFTWFVNLTNTSSFISWMCCCIVYLRFRKACRRQGVTALPYHSPLQPYLAYVTLFGFTLLLLINGFTVFFPGEFTAAGFLTDYIGIAPFVVIYFGHRLFHWGDRWARRPEEVDLHSNLDEILALTANEPPKQSWKSLPWYKKLNFIWE